VAIAIVQYVLPEINEVPEQFSAIVLWRFRVAALGIQVVLWTTIGLLFGVLTERSLPDLYTACARRIRTSYLGKPDTPLICGMVLSASG
jgi:Probable cobalt transporter subunit (CbtA)